MENTYTAVFEQAGGWWIGYVEEIPGALAQEKSLEEARASLREAIQDIVAANREIARRDRFGNAIHEIIRVAA